MYLLTLSRANGTNKTEYVLPTIVCSCCHVLKRPQAGEIIGSSIVCNQPLVNISWYISYTWWFHLYVDQHGYSKQTIGSGQVGAEGLSGLSSPPCAWSVLLHVLPTLPQSTLFFATTILRKKQNKKLQSRLSTVKNSEGEISNRADLFSRQSCLSDPLLSGVFSFLE